ncbi:MAG: TIGR01458 family HAD-type hydrolase [Calditrichia bacterium]
MTHSPQNPIKPVKGFLIDIDGVLYVEKQVIRGAVESINYLQKNKIPFCLVTNTTSKSRNTLHTNLQRKGFKLNLEQVFSAPFATAQWLKEQNVSSINLFLRGDAYREFKDFRITNNKPEYVVIGDVGDDLTYKSLNQAFRLIFNGAKMIALQKNRYWLRGDGLAIDAGAIVAALEYAASKKARIIGKPSPDFFQQAIRSIGIAKENLAMIGDDMEADIIGAAKEGLYTIAVKTGKFGKRSNVKKGLPHLVLPSIADLPDWLEKQKDSP